MKIKELNELLDVSVVWTVISILYTRFKDPLKNKDPNLSKWIDCLQKYYLSKSTSKILSEIKTMPFDDRPELQEKSI
jgi:hypothetical protein